MNFENIATITETVSLHFPLRLVNNCLAFILFCSSNTNYLFSQALDQYRFAKVKTLNPQSLAFKFFSTLYLTGLAKL